MRNLLLKVGKLGVHGTGNSVRSCSRRQGWRGFIEALLSHKYNTGISETAGDPSSEGEERKGEAL
jgi:hypothetical protein